MLLTTFILVGSSPVAHLRRIERLGPVPQPGPTNMPQTGTNLLDMQQADMLEVARKMRGPGGTARVVVLDVDYSSSKYNVYLGVRASRHAYYLRPPEGMVAADFKKILDDAGGEEGLMFRYFVYPEVQTELKPILSADPFAEKYFDRNEDHRFLQIEGERPAARERIATLLEGLKEPFRPEDFPRISEFYLSSFRPASEGKWAEAVLLRTDGQRDELRKSEPGFHVAVAEHGFAREIDVHRPVVAGTEPAIILNTNEHTTDSGYRFLSDLAAYFGTQAYAEHAQVAKKAVAKLTAVASFTRAPTVTPHAVWATTIEKPKLDEQQFIANVMAAMKELLCGMKLLQKRQISRSGPYVTIQFPGSFGFGKGPSDKEVREVESVIRTLKGDPTFGSGWQARYQVDSKTGEMKIAAALDGGLASGWTAL